MQLGISTASFFTKKFTEEAVEFLNKNNIPVAEVFLSTYSEYTPEFAEILNKNRGNLKVNSVHALTTQFEPQLYTANVRARRDAFCVLEKVLEVANKIGARYYTFHGVTRSKKTPLHLDSALEEAGERTQNIIDFCEKYGITFSYENVHWCYYNKPGMFSQLKKLCPKLKGVLDIKQAWQSGFSYKEFVEDMGDDIVTVHLSDCGEGGKMCLPLKGNIDYDELFRVLSSNGFKGAALMEVYPENYDNYADLLESYFRLNDIAQKYF